MIESFDNTPLPLVASVIIPFASRVASVDTPAHSGSYIGIRRTAARTATIIGTLTVEPGENFEILKSDWADLQAAHDVPTPRALVVRDGWFYYALPESLTESEVETTNLRYQIDYKLGDPYAYSQTLSTSALATNGSTTINVGGTVAALPTFDITISTGTAGGTVTVANQTTGETCIILAEAAMQVSANSHTETVEIGAPRLLSGQFLTLAKGSNTITVTPSSGVSLSSASIEWRARSL